MDLTNTTFIIPLRIESEDRFINTEITLKYLCKWLKTNIIIFEDDSISKLPSILEKLDTGQCNIIHKFIYNEHQTFHRTKLLNDMLKLVNTPVVVNYDIDIILPVDSYKNCVDEIVKNNFDLVYPYKIGNTQIPIFYDKRTELLEKLDVGKIDWGGKVLLIESYAGYCQFFKTSSYISGGGENQNFISYGDEDRERLHRFITLEYTVGHYDGYVYHIEHSRGINSYITNPYYESNKKLFENISKMSKGELEQYYNLNRVTVVTCYYKIKSKASVSTYMEWIKNFMWVNDNSLNFYSVIFCDEDSYNTLIVLYPESNKRKYAIVNKENFTCNFVDWDAQWVLDIEKSYHSPDLYRVWNEKPFFIKKAIDFNFFNTDYFLWTDIGIFRNSNILNNYITYPNKKQFLESKIIMALIDGFSQEELTDIKLDDRFNNLIRSRIAGGYIGGTKDLLIKYSNIYYDILKNFQFFKGKDQILMTFIVLLNIDMFFIVRNTNWFYMLDYLS